MQRTLTVRRRTRRGGEMLVLAAIHAALLIGLAQVLPPRALGLFAAAIGGIFVLGRLTVCWADQEVSMLLRRLEMRRTREQLVLAGQATVLRFSALALGLSVVAAAAFEVFGGPTGAPSIVVSIALGAVGAALFDYGTAPRPGHLGHPAATGQRLAMPLSRAALTVGCCALLPGRADLALLTFASATLLFGLPPFLRTERVLGQLGEASLVPRLVKRTRWKAIEDAAGMLSLHVGAILLVALGQPDQAAVFALALGLALLFHAVFHPFERTLRTRAARQLDGLSTTRTFARLVAWGASTLGLALLGVPALVALAWWIPHFLAPELASLPVPLWLLGATAALLVIEAPALVAARAAGHASLTAFARLARLALVAALGLWWIPSNGALGAALALLTASAASLALLFALASALGRGTPRAEPRAAPEPVAAPVPAQAPPERRSRA
jgi:hypothetical protein